MSSKIRLFSTLAATAMGLGVAALSASAHADQLANIKAKKTLVCGTFAAIPPFGYPDPKTRETIGSDIELCRAVAKEMGVNAEIRGFPVGVHIPELKLGHIDIIIANMGYTKTRAEQVEFSDAYNVGAEVAVVPKDSGIKTLSNLDGKKISATKGSTSETAIKLRLKEAQPLTYQDASSAFLALQQGKVDAFVINNVSAAAFANQSQKGPKPSMVLDEPLYVQPVVIGMTKGETALIKEINTILRKLEDSGYMDQHWNKWFGDGSDYKLKRPYKVTPIKDVKFEPLP
ncbi:ABC transporter [Alicycliphilus denitrificans]|uniref:transporter substrate-binding domain-containing protein n=1 Tax=Alicycliphilus denitrificans TaxID=179636 RepID=UPI001914F325|nr:transporter substrate-binding domain-containing protein [Alicycliphilus denitrificans]MBN9572440.1 transporter substrate-binding domain-containing protein [Alicycliphilus denitrificans]BCN37798.1 ABC transporter [Alicycliphilus denitrificans]